MQFFPSPLGGNNLTILKGPYDQRMIGSRGDVVEFRGDVLDEPLRVEGVVHAVSFMSSDCEDTDIALKLLDVYPDGREMLVTDGITQARYRLGEREEDIRLLSPGELVPIAVKLPVRAIPFDSGHRVKVCISSSNYARYEINPNTSDPPYRETERIIANNTLHYGGMSYSAIIVPVVEEFMFVRDF